MTRGYFTTRTRRGLLTAAAFIVTSTAVTGQAWATCFTPGNPMTGKAQFATAAAGRAEAADDQPDNDALVGLWNAEFLIGNGPDMYDQAFQQFHADGTEMMLSRGLPPSLGNVCVGIWKQEASRTFKLKHMAWNWDADGHFIGTFVMEVTLRLDRRGNRYSGTWAANNFDVNGQVIPSQHAEGIARGTRITIE